MRLIDIDEHFRINKPFYDADIEMPLHRVKIVLEYAPTVEAIPIEWIKEWGDQFINDKGFYTGDGYDTIWDMLEAWTGKECDPGMTRQGYIKENVK